jgi:hypothetical protein
VAETLIENRFLIDQVDLLLNQKSSADDGMKYHQLPNTLQHHLSTSNIEDSFLSMPGLKGASSHDYLADGDTSIDDAQINSLYQNMVGWKKGSIEEDSSNQKPSLKKVRSTKSVKF